MHTVYKELLFKLDKFIRRYHTNLLLKGLLWFFTGLAGLFLFFVLIEYFGYFNSAVRAIIFYFYVLFNLVVFYKYVVVPAIAILKLGKRISLEEAARILGKHFKNEVGDRIINTLQLQQYINDNKENIELVLASIEQKSRKLTPLPFANAVDFKVNLKYLPYAGILVFVLIAGWFIFPYIFKESAGRIVRYEKHFEKPAPFQLNILNQPLIAFKNERFVVDLEVSGTAIPADVEIAFGNTSQKMVAKGKNSFSYEFRTINEPIQFFLKAAGFSFGPYFIELKRKAVFRSISVHIDYPAYTGLENEILLNVGDFEVPVGSSIRWEILAEDAQKVMFSLEDSTLFFDVQQPNLFRFKQIALQDFDYAVFAFNEDGVKGDSLSYRINVKPDNYPLISIQEYQDSVMLAHVFFEGIIRDDYGFTDLSFFYHITDLENLSDASPALAIFKSIPIDYDPGNLNQIFYYHIDVNGLNLRPGQTLEYFFQVADNDYVNGFKKSQTRIYTYSIPSLDELLVESVAGDENIKSGLNNTREEVATIQKEIDQLRRSMLENENITWEQQESLKQLLDKQKQAQESFEQLQQFSQEKNTKDQQFRETDENILKKQEELEKLFQEVLTDEMKELYQKIQDELEMMNREQVFDLLEKFQFEMDDLDRRLDRALELFKQLQVERMLAESIDAAERLAEKQDDLNQSLESKEDSNALLEQQDKLNNDFEKLDEFIQDMMDKNEQLSRPNSFEDTSPLQDEIKDFLEQALQQMKSNDSQKASGSQKKASGSMKKLAQNLQQMQNQMQQENIAEDIRALREILDNLIKTSFNQEDLMHRVRDVNIRDPRYASMIQEQRRLSNDLNMVQDSLVALSKRQIQIESFVTREIADINMNIDQAIDHLINRRKHNGTSRQQFVMTHVNNLALLLNESLQNMQMQMQAQGQGEGSPSPGSEGEAGFPDLRQMQEQMNQMLEQLQQGHQPMPGESGESGMGMSEQLARMAAEQEAIRSRLNEITEQMRRDGAGTGDLEQMMREMERTELDIVTNSVSRQTVVRQQRILSRLLEHEKAQLEREKEERRVGETANFYDLSNPVEFFEYNRIKNRGIEMLKSLPPGFRPWYKSLVENYFLNVEQ